MLTQLPGCNADRGHPASALIDSSMEYSLGDWAGRALPHNSSTPSPHLLSLLQRTGRTQEQEGILYCPHP